VPAVSKSDAAGGVTLARRLLDYTLTNRPWGRSLDLVARRLMPGQEPRFHDLVTKYDVIIMKHCYPSSDVLADTGQADPASPRQSLENYHAVYRLLRDKFAGHPDKLFIIWTLPPRHHLYQPAEGSGDENASRATAFSRWMVGDFLTEGGPHPNIRIWDFREIVTDPKTNFLKYEYELNHDSPDSHPNKLANNEAGPRFARFILNAATDFYRGANTRQGVNMVFLHHSTGLNVYRYPEQGIPGWLASHQVDGGARCSIAHQWYPSDNNMPVHYYRRWLQNQ
jgi:hypothetical protein